ncbi:NAD(+) diphosphatase [Deinococcus taeanensis]|uniref:NAD(+) diphosphatase n=1 Tax=Deinococcus taeanensis TaxID=2737050 RepID=UPI001CDC171A|nr:NAD(+) diphosphatase [Deinococcus taeanensis]UBV41426.1 NAD(+) diphosphatase [Deinococcus taeanensis]
MIATSRPQAFEPDLTLSPTPQTVWFVFQGPRLLVREDGTLPQGEVPWALEDVTPLGRQEDVPFFTAGLSGDAPEGWAALPVRACFGRLPDDRMGLAGYAAQVLDFIRTHRYCGRCASALTDAAHERSRRCPNCGLAVYPRVAPVAMVLIHRGQGAATELLLARSPHFPPGMYSAIAGFVEPSETLETAARREVLEEVGVQVGELRYAFSQPWPFPHSLMLGFDAEYVSGAITPQAGEIEDARWFPVTALPTLPAPVSIARALIDRAVQAALPL